MCGENVIAISADTNKNIRLNTMWGEQRAPYGVLENFFGVYISRNPERHTRAAERLRKGVKIWWNCSGRGSEWTRSNEMLHSETDKSRCFLENGVDTGEKSGIIKSGSDGVFRKAKNVKIEPMPKKQFQRIVKNVRLWAGSFNLTMKRMLTCWEMCDHVKSFRCFSGRNYAFRHTGRRMRDITHRRSSDR